MPVDTGRHGVVAVLLSLVLALSLLLPAVLAPQTTRAEDPAIYALVQMPSLENAKTIKYSVEEVVDIRGINAIVGCTLEQLDGLVADGYIVTDQCAAGDECLAQLAAEFESQNTSQLAMPGQIGGTIYTISERAFNWIDITGTGTNTGMHCDDDCGVTVPIGFSFDFFGTVHKNITISPNGFLTFSDNSWQWYNYCIPDPDNVPDSIYVFWDDLYSDCPGADIYYDTRSIGGKTTFIVEWVENRFCCGCGGTDRLTFEVILFQGSNNILFQYLSMTGVARADGRDATVGLENANNTAGFEYSCDSPAISDSLAVLFSREAGVDLSQASSPTGPKVSPQTQRVLNPPQVSLQYLSVNPQQTAANQPVTITTNVVNTGDQGSNYNVVLKINGQVEQTKMVAVGPQATQPVKFTVAKSQPGTYSVDIGDKTGSFTIGGDSTASEPVNGGLLAVIVVGFLLLSAAVGLIFAFRRSA